jgi:hypothetical protein
MGFKLSGLNVVGGNETCYTQCHIPSSESFRSYGNISQFAVRGEWLDDQSDNW